MKILVVAGTSGGHIFPALAFLEKIKEKYIQADVCLLLPKRSVIKEIENFGCKVEYIDMPSVRLPVNRDNIAKLLKLFKGFLESSFLLLRFQPDIVVGFGSISSVAPVMFAWFLRIKTLIHEQNVTLGRANRFLAAFTDKIACSFVETKEYLKDYRRKIVVTGNPLRGGLERIDRHKALDFFGFKPDKFTILVMGGSQGSRSINEEFLKAVSSLPGKFALQIIHLCGKADFDLLTEKYNGLNIKFSLFSFLESMRHAYSASDLVISRAGATTIAEIVFFGLPAIFVPYPYAYKHQHNNAAILQKKGCAILINDEELKAGMLKEKLGYLVANPDKLEIMRAAYSGFYGINNPADLLVKEAMSL